MAASWHARLQRIDAGCMDLAFSAPVLDTGRARAVLGWEPRVDAVTALMEGWPGCATRPAPQPGAASTDAAEQLTDLMQSGSITRRRLP